MNFKKEIKRLPHSRVEIKIDVAWEEWSRFSDQAATELSKDFKLDGFRSGKIPKDILEQKIGKQAILEKAAEKAIQKIYPLVIAEEKLEAISAPKVEILKVAENNELEFKLVVAVYPEISLKDWQGAIKKINQEYASKKPDVSDEKVEEEIKRIATSRAALVTVNRPAQKDDSVLVDFEVRRNGVAIENGTSRNHPLVLGSSAFIPGFEEQIIGMKEGEEKNFNLTFPEKYHSTELAGQEANFQVKLSLVQERIIPEINDEFAKSLGKFASLEELKKSFKEGMEKEEEQKIKEERRNKFIDKLIDSSEADLPHDLVHQEIHKMLGEFEFQLQSMGMNLETYLEKIKKGQDELEKEWEPQAERRVKAALVLEKLVKDQEIKVGADEIQVEMNKTMGHYKNVKDAEKNIDLERLYNYTKRVMENEEVLKYLESL